MVPRRVAEARMPPRGDEELPESLVDAKTCSGWAEGSVGELVIGSDGSGMGDCWPAGGASVRVKILQDHEMRLLAITMNYYRWASWPIRVGCSRELLCYFFNEPVVF